jgi:hypothetical protein
MSLLSENTANAAADIRQRRMAEAAAHHQARQAIASRRFRLSRTRREERAAAARWQPVVAAQVDLRCLRAD